MIKRRISKAKKLSISTIPEQGEISETLKQIGDDNSKNSRNNNSDKTKTKNKKRRQSTGPAKENAHKVQDLIQGNYLKHLPSIIPGTCYRKQLQR